MIIIHIAREYTDAPGGRFKADGDYSGEDFRECLLEPKYLEAKAQNTQLQVNMDGSYGYGSGFLDESFGKLAEKYGEDVLTRIQIVSEEETILKDEIARYMNRRLHFHQVL